ncbi:sn-glycerol-3-phosphate ABC transporter ATP-binding protein UgpC [Conexibacter sp. JD483]|uniref:ABC transporter ATP-binding protein n=1 Tax=unclassified Conexibacter TaxID=2627773 RepID=UPI00271D6FD6|nr:MULTISPECIES: sn-glycerol-3-phosphate ABC transporter ATP-binding protein UgpC [unclassified Conexibacter]MDO8188334.1 sn-glycerol-3-phosphate ABC transporter ATP-binding protein UgpC [Conexibacter sp. CPCC 205706]MDO8200718.1 sn-glycerol-3-phosphate ABC transporter ATP-binding protein UgpC [Conexibacter sp. CPCC 205762]MDR9369442.1 sn-glycerol-3-phosphate ABC transporter ATP-binding protein UgpC [Conexibacter sp. JD483]
MAEIVLDRVAKVFDEGARVLDDVSLSVADGELLVLVGPSGCGKSTLLRVIAGLEGASGGRVTIGGRDMTREPPARRDVAMVFQDYALYPHMTVRRNMAFAIRRQRAEEVERRVAAVAGMLEISDLLDRRPRALSGGQRQRVAMGRAIVREPQAFLMDEPLSNLDAKLRVTMRAELIKLHRAVSTTTVYVTHDQVEAMTLGDRVALMRDGRIEQCGSPRDLFERPANAFVAAFIGLPPMNLVEAPVEGERARLGAAAIAVPPQVRARLAEPRVVVGLRPSAFRHAAPADDAALAADVDLVEDMGTDVHVFFAVPGLRPALPGLVRAVDELSGPGADAAVEPSVECVARLGAGRPPRAGDRLTLAIDPGDVHFFDPSTGAALR